MMWRFAAGPRRRTTEYVITRGFAAPGPRWTCLCSQGKPKQPWVPPCNPPPGLEKHDTLFYGRSRWRSENEIRRNSDWNCRASRLSLLKSMSKWKWRSSQIGIMEL